VVLWRRWPVEIDPVALSYDRYDRYARIVVDIAACAERIFGRRGSLEERRKGLALAHQFLPNSGPCDGQCRPRPGGGAGERGRRRPALLGAFSRRRPT
jgi:hypothetical protein